MDRRVYDSCCYLLLEISKLGRRIRQTQSSWRENSVAEIKRLIALGCSFTYGHGLPDCVGKNKSSAGPSPSQMAWPNQLAKKLGIPTVNNLSRPGSSTKYALHALANNHNLLNDNAVIAIMYPHYNRSFFIGDNENNHLTMNPSVNMGSITKLEAHRYRKAFNKTNALGTQFLYAEAIKQYAKATTGRPLISIIIEYQGDKFTKENVPIDLHRLDYTHRFFEDDFTYNTTLNPRLFPYFYGVGIDGHHPSLKWHEVIGDYIGNHLECKL